MASKYCAVSFGKDDMLLCVDGDAAVIAYAKKHDIDFEKNR
jgi:hypothetical protein